MMSKKAVLDKINKIITNEKGVPVAMDGMLADAQLDSLGTSITLISIDAEFNILDPVSPEKDLLNLTKLSMRDLVTKCILSTTDTFTEQKKDQDI